MKKPRKKSWNRQKKKGSKNMANQFLTTKEIARAMLPMLQDNLVFPALAYTDYSDTFSKKGDTIQVKKPPVYVADEFSGNISVQDVKEENVLVTLDKIADVSVELSAKEMALNINDFTEQVLRPAALAIAEKINKDGLSLYKDVLNTCGTPGKTPSSLEDIAAVCKALNDAKVPFSQRYAVWDSAALAKLQTIPAVINAEKCGSTDALRDGSIGRLLGMENYMSQQVVHHTAGTLSATGGLMINIRPGVGSDTLILGPKSGTLSGDIKKGDILTVAGDKYVATADASAKSSQVTVPISPATKVNYPAEEAVTVMASHTANLAFNKNAFGFVTRPLEVARGADSYVTSFGGITLRVTLDYNIATKKQTMSVDTLYGFKTLYPELAVRVLG